MSLRQAQIESDFISAIKQSKKATKPYDTVATVKRIEGDIAWVHIPGGVDETPVARSISALPGDAVRVRVSGGSAWITGNDSAPPTDDATALIAKGDAQTANQNAGAAKQSAKQAGVKAAAAQKTAGAASTAAAAAGNLANAAKESAASAQSTAERTNVKLDTLIRKTDKGIEAGKVPDDSTLSEGSSITVPAVLVNANGSFDVLLVTYTNSGGVVTKTDSARIATFGSDAVIGKSTETHAHIDSDSFDIVDADGYLKASLGGSTPMIQIGKFTFVNRENGNLTLRLSEEE
jgi:hypothetical protein